MLVTVELPGLTITNDPDNWQTARLTDLKGWHDAPETRRQSELREYGYGVYPDDDPVENARYPIIYGTLLSLHAGDEWPLRDTIMRLKNLPRFTFTVTDPTGAWSSEVAVSGRIVFELQDDGWCRFEIPLEAADPRKYGALQTTTVNVPAPTGIGMSDPFTDPFDEGEQGGLGRVVCINRGTAPSEPTITITGSLPNGFEITHLETGRVIQVTRNLPDATNITIDNRVGEVRVDGSSLVPAADIPIADWFQIGAGETGTLQWRPLGDAGENARMRVDFREATW